MATRIAEGLLETVANGFRTRQKLVDTICIGANFFH